MLTRVRNSIPRGAMAKIILVEDDSVLANSVQELLSFDNHRVEIAPDGRQGLDLINFAGFDLIILDWHLPLLTGPEICKAYRRNGGKAPVLMLTRQSSTPDKVYGLEAGADDYLPKPFDPAELRARVNALLRRSTGFLETSAKIGKLELVHNKCCLLIDGRTCKLHPREFELIEFLLRHPNTYFTVDQLLQNVWESSTEVSQEALRVCINRLRTKTDIPGQPSLIETQRGWGYKIADHYLAASNTQP
jgi:two-component system, OmpR family, manganese sensing response regulator